MLEGRQGPLRHPALALAALLLVGCGDEAEPAPARSERLVDFSQQPPYVNSLERDPLTREYLLTTNRGFFRVDTERDRATPVRGTVEAEGKRAPIGTFLELNLDDQGELVGSGHPDEGTLPQYLGYLRSEDGGKTWRVISRLGDADLHKIVFKHDRLYAWDAVLSAIVISQDGGRTFTERFTPRGLIIDFEVDPEDPDRILAATEDELFRSEDAGETWRPLQLIDGVRLAWPVADRLYLAAVDGTVSVSDDGGGRLSDAGRVKGEPAVLDAESPDVLDMALSDGSILHSEDGGASWEGLFRP